MCRATAARSSATPEWSFLKRRKKKFMKEKTIVRYRRRVIAAFSVEALQCGRPPETCGAGAGAGAGAEARLTPPALDAPEDREPPHVVPPHPPEDRGAGGGTVTRGGRTVLADGTEVLGAALGTWRAFGSAALLARLLAGTFSFLLTRAELVALFELTKRWSFAS